MFWRERRLSRTKGKEVREQKGRNWTFFYVLCIFFFVLCVFEDMGWTDLNLAAWIGNVELVNRNLENTQCRAINEKDVKEGERKKERAKI